MSWEWSHTQEAYENVEHNLSTKPREWLEVVWAEWIATFPNRNEPMIDKDQIDSTWLRKFNQLMFRAKNKTNEYLIENIWQRMEQWRTCDNGGFLAHCCPHGCSPHKVPFDKEAQFKELEIGTKFRFPTSNKKFEKVCDGEYRDELGNLYVGEEGIVVLV